MVLFFDEADALFGKRAEVSDAHDRYANIETSYLLQRIEAQDGALILATNLQENIDPAFLRRIDIVVDFPAPLGPRSPVTAPGGISRSRPSTARFAPKVTTSPRVRAAARSGWSSGAEVTG